MAWVIGIREVRQVTVAADVELVGLRKGPVVMRTERVKVDLLAESFSRTVGRRIHNLPQNRGAGPAGTYACKRRATRATHCLVRDDGSVICGGALTWSIAHLVEPLEHYYATYVPPIRLGAKGTPRGRRAV